VAGSQPDNSEKYNDVKNLTDEELMRFILSSQEETKKSGK
jgi:hypothetical protein